MSILKTLIMEAPFNLSALYLHVKIHHSLDVKQQLLVVQFTQQLKIQLQKHLFHFLLKKAYLTHVKRNSEEPFTSTTTNNIVTLQSNVAPLKVTQLILLQRQMENLIYLAVQRFICKQRLLKFFVAHSIKKLEVELKSSMMAVNHHLHRNLTLKMNNQFKSRTVSSKRTSLHLLHLSFTFVKERNIF